MKISIAMATYNGAKHIALQLESFAVQTRLPNELIVSDDCSTDDTLSIVEDFARRAPFKVSIQRNDHNLGFVKNFEVAIHHCTGDIIFLSDQDDVWLPHKLETVSQLFADSPLAMVVINDATIVDENLQGASLTILKQFRSLGLRDSDFETGCCTAIRSSMLPLLLPIPSEGLFAHDSWLLAVSNRLKARIVHDEPLQYYRRHANNTSAFIVSKLLPVNTFDLVNARKKQDPRPWCQRRLRQLEALRARIDEKGAVTLVPLGLAERIQPALQSIEFEISATKARLHLLKKPRIHRLLPALWMYSKGQYAVFTGWKSLVKDIVLA